MASGACPGGSPGEMNYWITRIARAVSYYRAAQEKERRRLRRMFWESERLRAELSHLEREIYAVREACLTVRQKALLEQALRVRYQRVENEMLRRQTEITASGHLWNGG